MFSKFIIESLSESFFSPQTFQTYHRLGHDVLSHFKSPVSDSISKYIKANGHLDANHLRGEWFPAVPADVFISHSHADINLAYALAGFLKQKFGLNGFVDSAIWGNITDMQRLVDKPLIMPNGQYNYNKRNQSTAYVHLLLSTALTKMMDNAEAIFFLSTSNSLSSREDNITESVWIYHELFTSNFLRQKQPDRYNYLQKCFSGGVLEGRARDGFRMDFKVDLSKFKILSPNQINSWWRMRDADSDSHSLDILYSIYDEQSTRKRLF